jgi:hypothetical protein
MTMDFQQLNVGSSGPALLAGQGQGPVLLFNASQDTTVWLGSDPFNTTAGETGSTAPLPPLASVVIDGSQPVYGSCLPGQSAQVSVIPGGLNFFQLVELLVKTLLISASAGNGLFVYSGTPGLGNLIASIVGTTGTDPFGNPAQAVFNVGNQSGTGPHVGIAANGNIFISNLAGNNVIEIRPDPGVMLFYSGAPAPGNLITAVAAAAGADAHTNNFGEGVTVFDNVADVIAQLDGGTISYSSFAIGTKITVPALIDLIDAVANAASPALELQSPGTGNTRAALRLYGQSNDLTSPAVIHAVNAGIVGDNAGTPETWHYVGAASGLGTAFGAAWGNAGGGFANLAFRKLASPANEVEIQGTISTTGTAPNNNVFTLPAGYIPTNSQRFGRATAAVPAAGCNIQVAGGTGVVQVSNAPGGVATTIGVDIRVSLDL